jgi:hypothetical protein
MKLWLLATVVGPILLLVVLAWAMWRNKQSSIPKAVTEDATRRLYAREERVSREGAEAES